jgi:NAD(P)-dependent dehydrogenase (short-subunit alcohol dehydrogenase family)
VQVFGEGVVVVADRRLAGLAEPSAVVGDDSVTRSQQDCGLLLPGSTAQRIPVDQHYRLTGTVILIVEIDVARIFLTDINVWHRELSLFLFDIKGKQSPHQGRKHGVIGLTKSAALEYASRGIRINAVCPGTIDTPMVADMLAKEPDAMKDILKDQPIGRLGRPEEIAAAVLWLCSPDSSFVIGHALAVDGGYTAR